jgi:hypothetical protein
MRSVYISFTLVSKFNIFIMNLTDKILNYSTTFMGANSE